MKPVQGEGERKGAAEPDPQAHLEGEGEVHLSLQTAEFSGSGDKRAGQCRGGWRRDPSTSEDSLRGMDLHKAHLESNSYSLHYPCSLFPSPSRVESPFCDSSSCTPTAVSGMKLQGQREVGCF